MRYLLYRGWVGDEWARVATAIGGVLRFGGGEFLLSIEVSMREICLYQQISTKNV